MSQLSIDRALLEWAVDALEHAETRSGHLAQRVVWEHRGQCPPGFCAESCSQHRALVAALRAALEAAS